MSRRILSRLLSSFALLLTASAGMMIFVLLPYIVLERVHLLPDWDILNLIYLLAAVFLAWVHAGGYITAVVTVCEVTVVLLQPGLKRAKIEAALMIGLCTLTYLFIHVASRFNVH